jgi:predicted PurR-regulated permease PerM
MIETSKDLLYIVLSFCILWLTILISWFIYYLVVILRQVNDLLRNFRGQVEKITQAVENIKEKFEHMSCYFNLIVKAVEKIVDFARERKSRSTSKAVKSNDKV